MSYEVVTGAVAVLADRAGVEGRANAKARAEHATASRRAGAAKCPACPTTKVRFGLHE